MYKVNDWIKIIDKQTGNIIGAGQIQKRKDIDENVETGILNKVTGVSFDSKWFFNELPDKHFIIKDNPEHLIVEFKEENIPDTYYKLHSSEFTDDNTADVYREWGIDELDPEVEPLVKILNEYSEMTTVSSCCGHGIRELYVDIQFYNITRIGLLCKIIYNKFINDFRLTTKRSIVNINHTAPILRLESIAIGKEAYQKANELVKELEKWKSVLH